MMFHSFSTASPRHSIVSIDPAHLPHVRSLLTKRVQSIANIFQLLSTANAAAKEIERSHSVSVSSRSEVRPERSYSTGQAPPDLFNIVDDNTSTVSHINSSQDINNISNRL